MSAPDAHDRQGHTRLVLVEDNPGDAALLSEMLKEAGHEGSELVRFERLGDALEDLLRPGVACVLLDLSLPDAEGLEAVTKIRKMAPEAPIVVLTGRDDEVLAVQAVQAGAQDYLIKGRADGHLIRRSISYAVERKRAEVQLAHQALHDALTGLHNRAAFMDRLELALARLKRYPSHLAVLFVDVDGFKRVNDSLGHEVGDRVLAEIGERLRRGLRAIDTVARLSGDEFAILCEGLAAGAPAAAVAERVRQAFAAPFALGESELSLSASIGVATTDRAESDPGALLRDADAAAYEAKQRGRARYELFDEVMRARAAERMTVQGALQRALERGELRVVYQPVVRLDTAEIVGVEALARWEHPERGQLAPVEFIPLAEETGLILPIGAWVLEEACRQAGRWRAARPDLPPLAVSVNVSALQLRRSDLVEIVAGAISDAGIEPAELWLEVTESVVMDEAKPTSVLRALKDLGVRLAVDDFGTGFSSLSSLKRFPADVLKMDRTFVGGVGRDPQDSSIVASVVGLARALDLTTVAEGVERAEQVGELRVLGCDLAQGHHFAPPQPADAISELIGKKQRLGAPP